MPSVLFTSDYSNEFSSLIPFLKQAAQLENGVCLALSAYSIKARTRQKNPSANKIVPDQRSGLGLFSMYWYVTTGWISLMIPL